MIDKISFIVILMVLPIFAYGDIASTRYVESIANAKQDALPMAPRPTSGTYNVVWDADIGQFIFESYSGGGDTPPSGLQCDDGTYDLGFDQCIAASTNGNAYGYINPDGSSSKAGDYGLTENGTWGVTFSYGKIKGAALCSKTSGTYASVGDPVSTEGGYCWCKATSSIDLAGQEHTLSVSRWVFRDDYAVTSPCERNCAYRCGYYALANSVYRSAMFGAVGQ